MEYIPQTGQVETMLQYPEKIDAKHFTDQKRLNEFTENIKKFAFPYVKTLSSTKNQHNQQYSSLVQFYTFVFTDTNRIRQYGFCRSARSGQHILCLISYLPWYSVFINILNKISTIINEKETTSLYHFLEALYEYELPDPGNFAQIFSHDGLEEIRFQCPDRRVIPSINQNRNLLKFFAYFDLEKLIKIFTALLLERSILVVSKDLENLTSCALAFEYLIYPLEWLHTFVPIMPEHIDLYVFNQPFPFIYGIHTCIYEKLNKSQLENAMILLVDERQILNGDRDHLPENIVHHLSKKLKYFQEAEQTTTMYGIEHFSTTKVGLNIEKYDLLRTGPIKAFQDSVLMILDDYRSYLNYNFSKDQFEFNENDFFQLKNVSNDSNNNTSNDLSHKYISNENEFYHEFRVTQAFEEFCRDRCDYLKLEKECILNNRHFQKDFIDTLMDQFKSENSKLHSKLIRNFEKIKNKAKEKSSKLFNTPSSNSKKLSQNSNNTKSLSLSSASGIKSKMVSHSLDLGDSEKLTKKSSKAKVNLKFTNDNYNEDKSSTSQQSGVSNLNNNEDQFTSESSSTSSTTSINKINEMNTTTTNNNIEKRITIDLSNDPDIRKYFENNNLNKEDESVDNEKSSNTVFNLIDISENNVETKHSNKNEDLNNENPFSKDRFIDHVIEETVPNSVTILQPPPKPNRSFITSNSITDMSVLSPIAVPQPETKIQQQPASLNSILDEFDPIANKLDDLTLTSSTNTTMTIPSSIIKPVNFNNNKTFNINYQNLTARPFHSSNNTSNFKPNYNIHLPSSNSYQTISNNPNLKPIIQSQSFNQNKPLTTPTATSGFTHLGPTPYHGPPVQYRNIMTSSSIAAAYSLNPQSASNTSIINRSNLTNNNETQNNSNNNNNNNQLF